MKKRYSFLFIFVFFACKFAFSQTFEEVSNKIGLDFIYPGNDPQEVGAGITIFDVNNDGWDDIFQAGGVFPSKLWLNNKGTFIDATAQYGLDKLEGYFVQSASAGDYNNDGFEDLFICNKGGLISRGDGKPPLLLQNLLGEYFTPVFEDTFSTTGSFPASAWGDIDNDGFIDLYLVNYVFVMGSLYDSLGNIVGQNPSCNENLFYKNNGGNGFTEISKKLNLNNNGCGLAVSFTDYDNDNDVDLMLLNDYAKWNKMGNHLYQNNFPDTVLQDVSEKLNFYNEFYGMGIGIGDYNNNGILDYYLTNIGQNYLYENEINTFHEKGKALNIDLTYERDTTIGVSWSGLFFDIENDGDLDLFVSKGYLNAFENVVLLDQNKLFLNNGDATFKNISESSKINDSLANRGAATIDFDHDGDLDIVSSVIKTSRGEFGGLDQKLKLYENKNDTKNNWIGIKLVGSNGVNQSCLGCSVSFENNNKKHIREIESGSGHSSQSTKTLYFGLGDAKFVENIEVQWLGIGTSTIKKLKANHVYKIEMNSKVKKVY